MVDWLTRFEDFYNEFSLTMGCEQAAEMAEILATGSEDGR